MSGGAPAFDPALRHEERMRYEVLYALYRAGGRSPFVRVDSREFWAAMGGWPSGVEQIVAHLARGGLVTTCEPAREAGDGSIRARITPRGIAYIQRDARRRRTVR